MSSSHHSKLMLLLLKSNPSDILLLKYSETLKLLSSLPFGTEVEARFLVSRRRQARVGGTQLQSMAMELDELDPKWLDY